MEYLKQAFFTVVSSIIAFLISVTMTAFHIFNDDTSTVLVEMVIALTALLSNFLFGLFSGKNMKKAGYGAQLAVLFAFSVLAIVAEDGILYYIGAFLNPVDTHLKFLIFSQTGHAALNTGIVEYFAALLFSSLPCMVLFLGTVIRGKVNKRKTEKIL